VVHFLCFPVPSGAHATAYIARHGAQAMLTLPEKIVFAILVVLSLYFTGRGVARMVAVIRRGHGRPSWGLAARRAINVLVAKTAALAPTFRARPLTSVIHGLVAWGFMFYVLVNVGDVLEAYIPGFVFMGQGRVGDLYRLGADVFSVSVLVGMTSLLIRRYALRPASLILADRTLVHPKARKGIGRDSAIVGAFILMHVGGRFVGESLHLALVGPDAWQPLASSVAGLWTSASPAALEIARQTAWWFALGLILAFLPYFPYSKHIHLFMAPINYLLKPQRRSMGELDALDFEDESIEQFGAARLEDLSFSSLIDAYACIMCNRCQDACPAYTTGKVLSPAALEINKRYFINLEGGRLASGQASVQTLTEFAISPEAIWACTACGACNQVCPVGNEPMRDILNIRRNLVLMENAFPEQLQTAYRGMERSLNPWNVPAVQRLEWAKGLKVPTLEENPEPDILWWVGCAPATDPRAQKTAQAMAKVLDAAGVNFAVLGTREQCTGDAARRSGNEYLFNELAMANVEILNKAAPKRIMTTCPHCLHVLKNEYPAFGGTYDLVHHTQFLQELMAAGKIRLAGEGPYRHEITFHDPCYLGRQNNVVAAPRQALAGAGLSLTEMPRHGAQSFCCGAGGAQMWKEEESGQARVSETRLAEAEATGAETLAVGCPFCMIMLSSSQDGGEAMPIRDVVEIVAERMGLDT
jgi:Fe-S oxidoreductase